MSNKAKNRIFSVTNMIDSDSGLEDYGPTLIAFIICSCIDHKITSCVFYHLLFTIRYSLYGSETC